MRPTRHLLIGTIALTFVFGACASGRAGSKAGGVSAPVTLRIGTDDYRGRPASDQIEEFANRVEDLSGGSIVIEPVWHAAGDGPDWDQRVARMVVNGELDMGNIPARAWDTEGVTSLRALNAPFLITTDDLVAQVIDGDLASRLMSGLEDIGIRGLTLLPEGLRHPFAFDQPLLGPHDYAGKAIRTPTSETTRAVFAALGATATDDDPDFATQAGWESEYILKPHGLATGNVAFYPKVNSIVINAGVFNDLSSKQRAVLEQAADETRVWAIETIPSDAEAAAAFCTEGQSVVLATDTDLADLQRATSQVYDLLETDPLTKELIAGIRELKAGGAPAATVTPCGADQSSPSASSPTSTVLDGVYRYEVTEEMLRAAGVTDPETIRENVGTWTWTFSRGEAGWTETGPQPESNASEQADHFEVDGDTLSIVWPEGYTMTFRWKTNDHGDLLLTVVDAGVPGMENVIKAHTSVPFVRIGDTGETALPNGIYRAEVRLSDVTAAGYTNDDGSTGIWTMVLKDGTYALTCAFIDNPAGDCGHSGGTDDILEAGYAEVSGDTVDFVYDSDLHSELSGCALPCQPQPAAKMAWSLRGKDLVFSDLHVDSPRVMSLEKVLAPWVWIGDVEG